MDWQIGDDIGLRLEKMSDDPAQVDAMLDEIRKVAHHYGYKLRQWGTWEKIYQSCIDEQKMIEGGYDD